jgi:endonuclease YncB( thermonuclease family)
MTLRVALFSMILMVACASSTGSESTKSAPGPAQETTQEPSQTGQTQSEQPQPPRETARVARIIDGDTVELSDGRRVRYIPAASSPLEPAPRVDPRYWLRSELHYLSSRRVRMCLSRPSIREP